MENQASKIQIKPGQEADLLSDWYKLDNPATLFTLYTAPNMSCIFRVSAALDHRVNIKNLQVALNNIIVRFPYYRVNLRPGFFWPYWSTNNGHPKVILDTRFPCQFMPITKHGIFPFRVRAYYNRIAVEFHHSITDGTGSVFFIKALIAEYFAVRGIIAKDYGDIFRPAQVPDPQEYEDAYKKNYKHTIPPPIPLSRAFQLPFKLERKGVYHIITGILPMDKVLEVTKKYAITLTELLVSVHILALQQIYLDLPEVMQKRLARPIRIMVPVNARKIYNSKTMRNFFLSLNPGIDPRLGEHSFDEIINSVHHYMRVVVNDKYINMQIKRNVRAELTMVLRIIPLFFKRIVTRSIIRAGFGENINSGVVTNLGKIVFPDELMDHIEDFQFIPAPSLILKNCCAVSSFKDKLYINFGRVIKSTELEKRFFRILRKMGIPVKIETN